jgi:hypothetical protein
MGDLVRAGTAQLVLCRRAGDHRVPELELIEPQVGRVALDMSRADGNLDVAGEAPRGILEFHARRAALVGLDTDLPLSQPQSAEDDHRVLAVVGRVLRVDVHRQAHVEVVDLRARQQRDE